MLGKVWSCFSYMIFGHYNTAMWHFLCLVDDIRYIIIHTSLFPPYLIEWSITQFDCMNGHLYNSLTFFNLHVYGLNFMYLHIYFVR